VKTPRALLLDLDGTLVDSRRDIAEAANVARQAHGLAPLPLADIYPMIGDGARMLVVRAFGFPPDVPAPELEAALTTFKASYAEHPCVHTTLIPGAKELFTSGLACALYTNKPRDITELVLRALGIADAFAATWCGGDGPLKPAPDGVFTLLEKLRLERDEVWMIGDGPQDVGAGRAAGVFTVAIPGIAERELVIAAKPDRVLDSLEDLVRLLTAPR
jgi:phosphoglycolate phosphatase